MSHRFSARPCRLLGAALLLAGLTATGPALAQDAAAEREAQQVRHAQCMRENGFPEYPDPSPDGRLQLRVTGEQAPRFEAAQDACKALAPAGLAPDGVTEEQMDALLALAACVRDRGVADFPDPDTQGAFNFRDTGIDPDASATQQAMQACMQEAGRGPGAGLRLMITR